MMLIDACCTIGAERDPEPPAEQLLREMDRAGVDRAVVHPPDRCFAWENEAGNELTTAAAREHADRLIAAVTVNPWRPEAWDRLRQALEAGGKVLTFAPGVQGFVVGSKKLDPILENLANNDIDVPIYIHTGHHSHAAPSQLFLLARRFPAMTFIMGHSGSTDYALDVVPVCRQSTNVYMESSFTGALGFVRRLADVGWEKGIMGSGFPYYDLSFAWSELRRLLPVEHHEAVLGGNLGRLLGGVP